MNCESCGMPLGGGFTSKHDPRYCTYCQNQETGSLASKEQVREGSVGAAMRLMGKSREEAEQMADQMMPMLPRWRSQNQ